jgi:hypothetical protein
MIYFILLIAVIAYPLLGILLLILGINNNNDSKMFHASGEESSKASYPAKFDL